MTTQTEHTISKNFQLIAESDPALRALAAHDVLKGMFASYAVASRDSNGAVVMLGGRTRYRSKEQARSRPCVSDALFLAFLFNDCCDHMSRSVNAEDCDSCMLSDNQDADCAGSEDEPSLHIH